MSNLAQQTIENVEYQATKIWFTEHSICALLADGREVHAPLEYYPTLRDATKKQRENFEIFGEGTAIYFPDLDEYLSVNALVLGLQG